MRLAALALAACASGPVRPPDATTLLRQVAATYAHASSYADHGTITWQASEAGQEQRFVDSFSTRFTRDALRFESRTVEPAEMHGQTETVWLDHGRAYRALAVDGKIDELVETTLLAGLQRIGVTNRAALTVPHLLAPASVSEGAVDQYMGFHLAGEGAVDGHACWRIAGSDQGIDETVWIDERSLVIRRMESKGRVDTDDSHFSFESATTYAPVLDPPLAPAELAGPSDERPEHVPTPSIGILFDRERVTAVTPNSSAATAGVRVGDVLMTLDGHALVGAQLAARVEAYAIGEVMTLGLRRGDRTVELRVTVEDRREVLR